LRKKSFAGGERMEIKTMAREKVHVILEEYIPLFMEFREIAEKFC